MKNNELLQALDIMEKAHSRKIKISLVDDDLFIRSSRSEKIDPAFLDEIKANKDKLVRYFNDVCLSGTIHRDLPGKGADPILYEDRLYYEITPTQDWWARESEYSREFKEKSFALLAFKVMGRLNMDAYRAMIRYIVNRHESLRATFHKVEDRYVMYVEPEDSPLYEIDYMDVEGMQEDKIETLKKKWLCGDQAFNLKKGPLFLTRVMRLSNDEYCIAFKLHHIIYDGWSLDVMLRDLAHAYRAFAEGSLPTLPPLPLQYKDYMSIVNSYKKEYYETQLKYWRSLYPGLPPDLIIPGSNATDGGRSSARCYQATSFQLPERTARELSGIAKENKVNLFVLLQAIFKFHLYQYTGQKDIVTGTMVFGREGLEGAEDQIGFYARTNLLRTIFHDGDSLREGILKVKKANEDMQNYRACTLMEYISEILPPGQAIIGTFWKFNLEYADSKGYHAENDLSLADSIKVGRMQVHDTEAYNYEITVHLQFYHTGDYLELKVVYDSLLYTPSFINDFFGHYFKWINRAISTLGDAQG